MVSIETLKVEADLHVHTSASDGSSSPQQVVEEALELGLKAIAITDHDVVEGVVPAQQSAVNAGLEVIAGVEINTEGMEREVHILGYFIDLDHKGLKACLHDLRRAREARAEKIVSRLRHLGVEIDLERVMEIAGSGSVGRPHIALAMMEKGYAASVLESFHKYIGYGKPAYVPRYKIDPLEAIRIIRNAGGVAVFAHPGLAQRDQLIPHMVDAGLEGIEVFYPEHDINQQQHYLNLVKRFNLIATGGSDYHGREVNFRSRLGDSGVDQEVVETLRRVSRNHSHLV